MAIYELTETEIRPLVATTFREAEVRERQELQRVLREPVDVMSPDTLPYEQRKIGECLGSMDDLIAAEGRKLESLRSHKMQQLFPSPEEN